MKLQRSTVVLVAIALLLGGVVLLTQAERSGSNRSATAQNDSETSPVFEFEEADVVGLQIETDGQAVTFERDDAGFWQMTRPEEHPAEEAAIAFLLSRLTTDGLVQTTTVDAANPSEFGLDVPFATVDLTLADGSTHFLVLGDADFSGQNYYALIDPEEFPLLEEAGEVNAAIVTENILNGVDRPLEEWKAVVEAPELEESTPDETNEDEADESDDDIPPSDEDTSSSEGENLESEDPTLDGETPDEEPDGGRDESSADQSADEPEEDPDESIPTEEAVTE